MIETKVKIEKFKTKEINRRLDDATFKSFNHIAAFIRLVARRSIKQKKKPSPAGTPPHTQTKRLKTSIIYFADKKNRYAIIGPSKDIVGLAGSAHELGGKYKKEVFPKRPFMVPAMNQAIPKLPARWAMAFRS